MGRFTIRIELHGANEPNDYNVLHEEMENLGYVRTIVDDQGIEYYLPNGEYNKITDLKEQEVHDHVKIAVHLTRQKCKIALNASILVTGPNGRWWSGLEQTA